MKIPAAVLWETNQPWSVEDVELDRPKQGEILVKLAAVGLCHSDEHLVTGDLPVPLPIVGGHEGAGVVVQVGPGVQSVSEGDHVVLSFIPSCGRCPSCVDGYQNLCDSGANMLSGLALSDGTHRIHARGHDLGQMCTLGAFAPYVVVHEYSAVVIDRGMPLDKASLLGCGVPTGWGSATHLGEVKAGDTVVVVGAGGIGMNAVQGARFSGARHVVAVDPVALKREQAEIFGATHTAASMEEAMPLVAELTLGRMANVTILTAGVATSEMIAPLLFLTGKHGRAVVTAVAPMSQMEVSLSLVDLAMMQKHIVGGVLGGCNPRTEVPKLVSLYREGHLKLDELVKHTYRLDQINEAYQDMRDGRILRGLVLFDD
ncbi:NDMA-dependent alcohol dehydrogenase [[Mycobacterium] vasticus]|uniref:alcohol dehydrogenase n=1 Tax=[Mycobacterium] vasticus TaxID=2875777 RepID=A0ABU5Z061_9MYCO|nr:NDMA-dependent alcohol dehydrogenase [Mycolicibacter sp. MYC017]MEB3070290.1 NDMA-dependent alcohol dehydrogenase [Mycolicibacter sp. MYC017]